MKKPILIILTLSLIALPFSCRKSDFVTELEESITDQGGGTGTATWSSDRDYLLNGFVFVNDGQTLTIKAGTVIRAKTGQGSLASALIVARGGTLIAEGDRDNPIVFTVEGDDLEGSVPVKARGLWGGLIILGNAGINTESGEDMIEGIPVSEPRGIYGGGDDNDNSGILRYVSIRHGGTNIGEGNEINGLTLGGVGRKTTIENVEVISNADDGVEFFGGAVNCRNLVVSFCGDDAFDMDQGYKGKGQFWVAVNDSDSDRGMEISGGLSAIPSLPDQYPLIYNATLWGYNKGEVPAQISFGAYGGGHIRNSILMNPGSGIEIIHSENPGDSWSLFKSGRLSLEGNILHPKPLPMPGFYLYSEWGTMLADENQVLADSMMAWNTSYADPGLGSEEKPGLLPPSSEFTFLHPYENSWFEEVTFKGAFGSNYWIEGWTLIHSSGLLRD